MFHYLFTNDLRISKLNEQIQNAGKCFINDEVPSATDNKSYNNHLNAVSFYFNIYKDSVCAQLASVGNVDDIILNFIKKFQFPNPRTTESLNDYHADGIILAPLRIITKALFFMKNSCKYEEAYLSKDEIKDFIFYNSEIAKNENPDIIKLIYDIQIYRTTGNLPSSICKKEERVWNQEERQLRELLSILTKTNCISEENGKYRFSDSEFSEQQEKQLFEILNYNCFWKGDGMESYREYMDIKQHEYPQSFQESVIHSSSEVFPVNAIIDSISVPVEMVQGNDKELLLGQILKQAMDSAKDNTNTATIHYFGLSYAYIIQKEKLDIGRILDIAGMNSSYKVEILKMVRLFNMCRELDPTKNKTESMPISCMHIKRTVREDKQYPLNLIVYGAPGTGKTYAMADYSLSIIEGRKMDFSQKTAEERNDLMDRYNQYAKQGRIVFTTFHQSYGYEEFIQGLRPNTESDQMSFEKSDGVFKRIADKALKDTSGNKYVIIIDEINRANISKVFGELITLIEEDKRWGEVNQTCVTLQSGDVFAVPNNLYIIGTMNSADKSISLIDAALRRRFEFIEQYPDVSLVKDETLRTVLKKINDKLADDLASSDLLIGHSYFMNKEESDLCKILNNSVIPLLYEYYYDDKKKVYSTLNIALKDLNYSIVDMKTRRLYVEEKDSSET